MQGDPWQIDVIVVRPAPCAFFTSARGDVVKPLVLATAVSTDTVSTDTVAMAPVAMTTTTAVTSATPAATGGQILVRLISIPENNFLHYSCLG